MSLERVWIRLCKLSSQWEDFGLESMGAGAYSFYSGLSGKNVQDGLERGRTCGKRGQEAIAPGESVRLILGIALEGKRLGQTGQIISWKHQQDLMQGLF